MDYLLYVDESGDPGLANPNRYPDYFALTGLIIAFDRWRDSFNTFKSLKIQLRQLFNFFIRQPIHARELFSRSKEYEYMKTNNRKITNIFQHIFSVINTLDVQFLNIYLIKNDPAIARSIAYFNGDIEEMAWNRIATRFHNYLNSLEDNCHGMIIPDPSRTTKIKKLLRKWRVRNNQVGLSGSYNCPLISVIEDPFFKKSSETPFIQLCDCVCFSLAMQEAYKRRVGGWKKYEHIRGYKLLSSVTSKLMRGSRSDPQGIVRS